MSDEEQFQEIGDVPHTVPETNRLFRLSPTMENPEINKQMAIVAAETAEDARSFASKADPLGRNWNDRSAFDAYYQDTAERHVVGDIVFRSLPAASNAKRTTKG
jgi:hypothetical protein